MCAYGNPALTFLNIQMIVTYGYCSCTGATTLFIKISQEIQELVANGQKNTFLTKNMTYVNYMKMGQAESVIFSMNTYEIYEVFVLKISSLASFTFLAIQSNSHISNQKCDMCQL